MVFSVWRAVIRGYRSEEFGEKDVMKKGLRNWFREW